MIPQDAGFPEPAKKAPTSRRESKPVAGRIDSSRRRGSASDLAPTMVPAALSSPPDLTMYLQALKRRWVSAAALGGTLAVLAALAAWFLLSPKYIAFGRVRVAFDVTTPLDKHPGGRGDFSTYLKTQAAHLAGRRVISEALEERRDQGPQPGSAHRQGSRAVHRGGVEGRGAGQSGTGDGPDELPPILRCRWPSSRRSSSRTWTIIVYAEKEERLSASPT